MRVDQLIPPHASRHASGGADALSGYPSTTQLNTVSGVAQSGFNLGSGASGAAATASGIAQSGLNMASGLSGLDWRLNPAIAALPGSGSVTPDFTSGSNFTMIVSGDVTLNHPSGYHVGQAGVIVFTMSNSGFSGVFDSGYLFTGGADPDFTQTSGAKDRLTYWVEASGAIHCEYAGGVA